MSGANTASRAQVWSIIAVVVAGLGLLSAANTYIAHNKVQCGGGLGWIGPGLTDFSLGVCAALLALGLAMFTIGSAVIKRQWAWVVGLLVTVAFGAAVAVGSDSTLSHSVVGAVLGTGCSWFYPEVTALAALLLVAVVELVYIFSALRTTTAQ